jgi:3-hydroxyisobutyrate dehydrogenase-like beta-hydroxyacid dehydrogenase
MTNGSPTIGCAGAGILGSAIARRLLESGFSVGVWNRDRAKLSPLVELGAIPADTPAELARDRDVVLTCVTGGKAVEAIVFGTDGVATSGAPEKLLIDMSTSDAGHTRDMAERLRDACGMGWLDAPISGGAPAALEGRMAVMVGGAEADFQRARPLWDALAGRCTLMGPNGAGQTTKMINQILVSCTFAVLAEACGLAEKAGVDATRIPHALQGGRADSRLLQEFMPKMAKSEFSVEGTIAIMMKDLHMIRDLADRVELTIPVTANVAEQYQKMIDGGLAEKDCSELVTLYRAAD